MNLRVSSPFLLQLSGDLFFTRAKHPSIHGRGTPARLAGEVVAGADAELLAVPAVVAHQRVHLGGVPPAAREATVDGPDGGAEPPRHGLVRAAHPGPERRLEGDHGVLRHPVRVPQQVDADALPRRPVVEVPRQLQRAAPVVLLPRGARPLPAARVAELVRPVDLADVAEVCCQLRTCVHGNRRN